MFNLVTTRLRPWQAFLCHILLIFLVVPLLGLLNYWVTPLMGVLLGGITTERWRSSSVLFAWIPSFLLFADEAITLFRIWNPTWAYMSRWQYVKNTLFGPQCSSSECLDLVITAIFLGGIGYAIGGYLALRRLRTSSELAK